MSTPILQEFLSKEVLHDGMAWSLDAMLYQPYEAEQILLAEAASCLAVKTFLNMCKLSYTVKTCPNAEFMSPGGRLTKVPLLRVGAFSVAEFEPIVNLVETKGVILTADLDSDQKSDMRAYMSLAENVFTSAELYLTWVEKNVLEKCTYPRNGSVYPWPLNHIQNWKKRNSALKYLKVYGWRSMSLEEVVANVRKCCETLSNKLEMNEYFYGDKPTEVDALIFGHLFTILTTHLPNNVLAEVVNKFPLLVQFCNNIDAKYFQA